MRYMLRPIQILFTLMILVCGSSLARAQQAIEMENKAYFLCKNMKQARTIRVHIGKDGQCSTYYSKEGSEKSVGNGKNADSCLNILNNIKTNLEKSSWTCRDISSTRITASAEE